MSACRVCGAAPWADGGSMCERCLDDYDFSPESARVGAVRPDARRMDAAFMDFISRRRAELRNAQEVTR